MHAFLGRERIVCSMEKRKDIVLHTGGTPWAVMLGSFGFSTQTRVFVPFIGHRAYITWDRRPARYYYPPFFWSDLSINTHNGR